MVGKAKARARKATRLLGVPLRRREERLNRVPGLPPGTLVATANPTPSRITLFSYGPDSCQEAEINDYREIAEWRGKDAVTWINIDGIEDVELVRSVGDMFGLHQLALEDAIHTSQRPKVDDYGDHVFVIVRMPEILPGSELELEQMSIFIGEGFVITVQEKPGDCLGVIRDRIRSKRGRIRQHGADYLAYAIMDAVVDYFFPILDKYTDRIQACESTLMASKSRDVLTEVHAIRGDLARLRRGLWPLRDAVNNMIKGEIELISDDTRVFLRDCQDHCAHHIDVLEALREMVNSLMELHNSALSQRMNEIMKVLTLITTVFIPMTFIAGVYGMNFDRSHPTNMPELGWRHGYLFAWLIMIATGLGFLWFFWTKGWFSDRKRD